MIIDLRTQFTCDHCGAAVRRAADGIDHNHCPECMWSRHVGYSPELSAEYPEAAGCGEMMRPVKVWDHPEYGPSILHRCVGCGFRVIGPSERVCERTQVVFPSLGLTFTIDGASDRPSVRAAARTDGARA